VFGKDAKLMDDRPLNCAYIAISLAFNTVALRRGPSRALGGRRWIAHGQSTAQNRKLIKAKYKEVIDYQKILARLQSG
jgi:hypothetical protein